MRDALAVDQSPDEPDRLVESIEPLAEPRAEVEPEGVVLALEPAAAQAEHEAAVREVVDGGSELRRQPRVAERVGADQQTEPDPLRQDGEA